MLEPSDFQLEAIVNEPNKQNVAAKPQLTSAAEPDTALPAELNLEQLEKNAISLALKKHRFNISHTAKELGLTRAALYRRMEKHGL